MSERRACALFHVARSALREAEPAARGTAAR